LPARDQLTLPFLDADGDQEPAAELGLAALRDTAEEMRSIRELIEFARAASASESKIAAVRRIIRRTSEPLLVFTEYRDTLQHLASLLDAFSPLQLHGGLGGRERIDVLRQFTSGDASLLLATDAASEGLNLHHRCRLVINLELPWTPSRLEQRIGRVDRLGQRRRVHAMQLVARGTHEDGMVERFDQRAGRIHAAFDPGSECDGALRTAAREEATRLIASRALASDAGSSMRANRPLVTTVRSNGPSRSALWAFRLSFADAGGQLVFDTVAGLLDRRHGATLDPAIDRLLASHHHRCLRDTADGVAAWLNLATAREKAIAEALRGNHARLSAALLQPGLFDRRAERAAAVQTARVEEAIQKSHARLAALERWRHLRIDDRSLVFGITYR
jgi:hypothetical protein